MPVIRSSDFRWAILLCLGLAGMAGAETFQSAQQCRETWNAKRQELDQLGRDIDERNRNWSQVRGGAARYQEELRRLSQLRSETLEPLGALCDQMAREEQRRESEQRSLSKEQSDRQQREQKAQQQRQLKLSQEQYARAQQAEAQQKFQQAKRESDQRIQAATGMVGMLMDIFGGKRNSEPEQDTPPASKRNPEGKTAAPSAQAEELRKQEAARKEAELREQSVYDKLTKDLADQSKYNQLVAKLKDKTEDTLLEKGLKLAIGEENPFTQGADTLLGLATPTAAETRQRYRDFKVATEAMHIQAGHGILGNPDNATDLARAQVTSREVCPSCVSSVGDETSSPLDSMKERAMGSISGKVNPAMLGKGLDMVVPGPEGRDSNYENAIGKLDIVRNTMLKSNPFVGEIQDLSFQGVTQLQRKAIGQMDVISGKVDSISAGDPVQRTSSTGPVFRPSPPAPSGGGLVYIPTMNTTTYHDPVTQVSLEIPHGYILFRAPGSQALTTVRAEDVSTGTLGGDRSELGDKGCSLTGVGVVTPACERWRRARANPFATR